MLILASGNAKADVFLSAEDHEHFASNPGRDTRRLDRAPAQTELKQSYDAAGNGMSQLCQLGRCRLAHPLEAWSGAFGAHFVDSGGTYTLGSTLLKTIR